ncbi:hypothetical protein MKW98_019918 [Papaver atlanticum]|uniref:Uncharacterized protein n=1 Tax=Papaver atlanticum TaxID=357466 RepID=A0AAD4S1E1_9MAGN|nr:hypothetical protein MKW98_019918 [Papaver atlanticum]
MGSSVCGSLVEVFELWKLLSVSAPYDLNIHIMDFQPWRFLNVQQEHRRLTSNGTMLHLSRYLQILNWQLIQLFAFFLRQFMFIRLVSIDCKSMILLHTFINPTLETYNGVNSIFG